MGVTSSPLYSKIQREGVLFPLHLERFVVRQTESLRKDKKENYAGKLLDQSLLRTVWSNQKTH